MEPTSGDVRSVRSNGTPVPSWPGRLSGMDQGLAAVLGASVGVVGTTAVGALGWLSARTQVRAQARAERQQWRSQHRRETYSKFLVEAEAASKTMEEAYFRLMEPPTVALLDQVQSLMREYSEQSRNARSTLASVSIEGPPEALAAAREVLDQMENGSVAVLAASEKRRAELANEPPRPMLPTDPDEYYHQSGILRRVALDTFTEAARAALDTVV
ncbi:hypothetical protein AB0H07_40285 [Streptomyces sp. NPDC021354]|uniref:hypothetical protein n=1 Tax=Streptomyces sp. NPDC021354 TaxID=3154793 RepID=UPI0033E6C276